MIDLKESLFDIIRCPVTGGRLRYATHSEINPIKEKMKELYAREGIEYTLLEVLVNVKLTYAYGVVDRIPVLLADKCIAL